MKIDPVFIAEARAFFRRVCPDVTDPAVIEEQARKVAKALWPTVRSTPKWKRLKPAGKVTVE